MQWYYAVTFAVRWEDVAMIHAKTKPSCHYLNRTLGRNKFQHNKGRPWMGVTTIDRVVHSASQHNWWHNRFHITTGGTRIIDPVPDSDQWIMKVSGSNVRWNSLSQPSNNQQHIPSLTKFWRVTPRDLVPRPGLQWWWGSEKSTAKIHA